MHRSGSPRICFVDELELKDRSNALRCNIESWLQVFRIVGDIATCGIGDAPSSDALPFVAADRFHERYSDRTEPVFPPELMLSAPSATAITGECVTWHCPTSLKELLRLKASCSEARIVAGNTAVRVNECDLLIGWEGCEGGHG